MSNWHGVTGATKHQTVGSRAWCLKDQEWCYPETYHCACCRQAELTAAGPASIKWKHEFEYDGVEYGPIWFHGIAVDDGYDSVLYTDAKVTDSVGDDIWFPRGYAEAIAATLSLPLVEV